MSVLLLTLLIYGVGLVLTAVGSRLAGRCTTWCCALCGLPMWVVGGTVAPFCLALPQLMLAFLAAGLSITSLAVGTALAGAVANLGLALAICLLNPRHEVSVDRNEFCRKCLLLLAACVVLIVFVRDGSLSYTGTGLLMFLFVVFVLISIVYQHHFIYGEGCDLITTAEEPSRETLAGAGAASYGYTAHTMAFPVMSVSAWCDRGSGTAGRWRPGAGIQRCQPGQSDRDHSGPVGRHPDQLRLLSATAGGCAGPSHRFRLEAFFHALPVLSAQHAAHPAAEQCHPEPDAGTAYFQPDVPAAAPLWFTVPAL